jgi:LPS O-antigen subunit length determinant protein (WzzB/FepE family)
MRTNRNILLVAFILGCTLVSVSTYASSILTGTIESKKVNEKYSLKNLNSLTHKTATFYTLKSSLEFKGFASNSSSTANSATANYLKYNKGNVSYVIPYHYNVILSKFKTPTAQ